MNIYGQLEGLDTLVLHNNETATVNARILYADNSIVYTDNGTPCVLDDALIENIVLNYNKSIKRPLGIGRVTYPPILLEHSHDANNVVGSLRGKMTLSQEVIEGKTCKSIHATLLLTDPKVIADLQKKGKSSEFAKVSVGVDITNLKNPHFFELSLTSQPAKESALLLSKGMQNIRLDKHASELIANHLKLEKQYAQAMQIVNKIKEDERKHKLELSMRKRAGEVLHRHIAKNRITKKEANLILSKHKVFTESEIKLLDLIMSTYPSKRLPFTATFTNNTLTNT